MSETKTLPEQQNTTPAASGWVAVREQWQALRADPEKKKKAALLALGFGVTAVASVVLAVRYDIHLPPLTTLSISSRPTHEKSLGERAAELKSVPQNISASLRTRKELSRAASRSSRENGTTRQRLAGAAAALLMTGNVYPAAATETHQEHQQQMPAYLAPVAGSSINPFTKKTSQQTTEQPRLLREAQPGDSAEKWASQLLTEAQASPAELTPQNVHQVAGDIINANPVLLEDARNWMNLGDSYDVTRATQTAHNISGTPVPNRT